MSDRPEDPPRQLREATQQYRQPGPGKPRSRTKEIVLAVIVVAAGAAAVTWFGRDVNPERKSVGESGKSLVGDDADTTVDDANVTDRSTSARDVL